MEARREAARRGRSETARCGRSRRGTELFDNHHRRDARSRDLAFGPAARRGSLEANIRPPFSPTGFGGATVCDAQADVPSAGWLRAQLAFKDSMVHGILQFTPSIAFRYVLHRCESRDIRCRESFWIHFSRRSPRGHRLRAAGSALLRSSSLARPAPRFVIPPGGLRQRGAERVPGRGARGDARPPPARGSHRFAGRPF